MHTKRRLVYRFVEGHVKNKDFSSSYTLSMPLFDGQSIEIYVDSQVFLCRINESHAIFDVTKQKMSV